VSILSEGIKLNKSGFATILLLQFSFLTWYYIFSFTVLPLASGPSTQSFLPIFAVFNVGVVIAMALTSIFLSGVKKTKIIYFCAAGLTVATPFFLIPNAVVRAIILVANGAFLGIGQLLSFTFFWRITNSSERGRVAGFAAFLYLPLFQILTLGAEGLALTETVALSSILSAVALTTAILRPDRQVSSAEPRLERTFRTENKTVFFYLLPWIIFSIINSTLARNSSVDLVFSTASLITIFILQTIGAGLGALAGGIIADFFGRRLALGLGLTFFGVSEAIGWAVQSYQIVAFSYFLSGLTWGILWVMYGAVVWGDLSNEKNYTKRYATGLITFYLATGIGYYFTPQVLKVPLMISALASCVLIFLSNTPLVLAPELLSSDFLQRIRLKRHINAAKKISEKELKHQD
jgi:hypothetical protein